MGDLRRIGQDPDAFETFYREHLEAVRQFVVRRVGDPHLAADLIADVFLAAIDSAHTYRPDRGSPAAWLYGVARNVVSADWRRQALEDRTQRRIAGRRLLDEDDVARLLERIDAEAKTRELFDAMADLPDGERAVLELVALDGLPVRGAAAALGIRPVAARVRLHRARASMRERLRPPRETASVTETIQPEVTS